MQKVLVTGGSGFLGSVFLALLKANGIPYELYNRAHPEKVSLDFDTVVHFAGITPLSSAVKPIQPQQFYEANVEETKRLLRAIAPNKKLRRFIHVGSASEYGIASTKKLFTESDTERPINDYGKSKRLQSQLIQEFGAQHNVQVFNLRLFNVVGLPVRDPTWKYFQPSITESLLNQFTRDYTGTIAIHNAKSVRDFVDIEDVAHAVLAALRASSKTPYELINISSGKGVALRDLIRVFEDLLPVSIRLRETNPKSDVSIGANKKAKTLLKWEPRVTLKESIERMLATKRRVLVVGAGVAGRMLIEQMHKEKRSDIVVVACADDDKTTWNKNISGVRVMGGLRLIPALVRQLAIDQVLLSIPSVKKNVVEEVVRMLPPGFSVKVLPSISSVILGKVDLSYIRDIDLSDIIGRPLVKTDQQFISSKTKGKTFLVTGAAGSIGSEIVRQLHTSKAHTIIAVDSWEEGIFNLQEELRVDQKAKQKQKGPQLQTYIGNIRDVSRLKEIFAMHKVDVVIHAAAYKHVPLMEANVGESLKTNYQGTKNVINAALNSGVKDFVLISTDKAVYPTSVMGKSKRKAELLVQLYARKNPQLRFCAVRFGNVLNSSGSVIPKFLRQIRNREAVTVTDPNVTRYFMSIPEAVSLVLLSWIVAKNGQILVLDMGQPVKILDLAVSLIKMHGLEPNIDIPLQVIGMRPGEKLHEELSYDKQKMKQAPLPRIFIAEEL